MKVFFITNPRNDQLLMDISNRIYNEIIHLGHTPLYDINSKMIKSFSKEVEKKKLNQQIFYKEIISSIGKADICVFEASLPSLGLGYLIEKSIILSKSTIVLFYKDQSSCILTQLNDDRFILKVYNERNVLRVLKSALALAKERRDKRFNFYLSTKLLEHVDTLSQEEGVTKSKIMRDIILRDMRQRGKISAAEFEEELG